MSERYLITYPYVQATSERGSYPSALITPWKPKTLPEIIKHRYFCEQRYLLAELALEKNDKAQDQARRALLNKMEPEMVRAMF